VAGPHEHPVGPAFDKAREWEAEQQRRLTEAQRRAFQEIKQRQEQERKKQHERLEAVREQLRERAKSRKPKAQLVLNPPVLVKDPYTARQARFVIAGEKRLERLDRRHAEERIRTLKAFEQERERQKAKPAKDLNASWKEALAKTAKQERSAKERGLDLSDDFGKAR